MRSKQDIYDMLLNIADNDETILAIYINGSRTNINIPKDIFQDYDIVFVVTETKQYIENENFVNLFGEILYMQYPDKYYSPDSNEFYGILMQFKDGVRIDLHMETLKHAKEYILKDKLCEIILDKKNLLPDIPKATDEDYWIKKPTQEQYKSVCNEFWWCTNNIAKGLWREEITYVQDIANFNLRKELEKMLSWKVGVITNFSVSVGKSGKYLNNWLEKEEFNLYLETYFSSNITEIWTSIEKMCELFSAVAIWLGNELKYEYNYIEDKNAKLFLNCIKNLPKNAKEIPYIN